MCIIDTIPRIQVSSEPCMNPDLSSAALRETRSANPGQPELLQRCPDGLEPAPGAEWQRP